VTGTIGLVWLVKRETLRVSKLWTQTVLAPIISAALFIVVFGFSLGGRIKEVEGFPYKQFIVPGLIVMAMVQAAYSNNSSSVFQARSDRYINDVLSAPMRAWQIGALGTIVGIFAETFDHHTFVNNIVILPLAFVGGTFYSVDRLGSPWHELSHANPVFYLVNAVRYGFLGHADVSVWLSLLVLAGLAIPAYLWSQWLFSTGRKLKA
jgi:ABC-2 type transport system permease protein